MNPYNPKPSPLTPKIALVITGALIIIFAISLFVLTTIRLGIDLREGLLPLALETILGLYLITSGILFSKKSKICLINAVFAEFVILTPVSAIIISLHSANRYGVLFYLGIFTVSIYLASIFATISDRENFGVTHTNGPLAKSLLLALAILVVFAIILSASFYSGIGTIHVASKNYTPELYIWGDGYNYPEYLKIYQKFNIKRVLHFTTLDCNENSKAFKLAKLYRKEGVDFIVCIWYWDYVSASNSKRLLETWDTFKAFYLKNKKEFGGNFYVAIDSESGNEFYGKRDELIGKTGGKIGWRKHLLSQYNKSGQKSAASDIQKFVNDVKSLGLKPMLVAMSLVIDDQLTPANNLQTLYDLASSPPHNWDSFGYMIYRQDTDAAESYRLGNHFIYSYARSIKRLHGNKSNILLGVAGRGAYRDINEIIKDVHIAKSQGINMIGLYSINWLHIFDSIKGIERIASSIQGTRKVSFNLKLKTTLMRHRNFLSDILLSLI